MRVQHSAFLLTVIFISLVGGLDATCEYNIVESMPDGLKLKDPEGAQVIATYDSLLDIVERSKKTLRIASFYWYLTPPVEFDNHPATLPGRMLMDAITRAAARGVDLQVVLDGSIKSDMNNKADVWALKKMGTVKYLNLTRLLHSGIMHSKLMIADNETFYLGSSNFDWRSYTEIKEMGLTFRDCAPLAQDLDKIFRTYMLLADAPTIPDTLTDDLKTSINMEHPFELKLRNSLEARLFFAGAPPQFNGKTEWTGRTNDIDALLHLIDSANHRISISVMNYSPRTEFSWPKQYWPRIDDALRRAATTRRVRVELLFSNWTSTRSSELAWYRSLNAIQSEDFRHGGIHVKLFKVPAFDDYQRRIPYARVKHDKYMVTDGGVYLGTSNWTPDYFTNTAGVSLVIRPKGTNSNGTQSFIVRDFQDIFDRDFKSDYAHEL